MKRLMLTLTLSFTGSSVFAQPIATTDATELCIMNKTDRLYYIYGKDAPSRNWEGTEARPDKIYRPAYPIKPSETRCEQLDITTTQYDTEANFDLMLSDGIVPPDTGLGIRTVTHMAWKCLKEVFGESGPECVGTRRLQISYYQNPPTGTPGRLEVGSTHYKCSDPRDGLFEKCSLVVIKN
jgi:hypothetical protein